MEHYFVARWYDPAEGRFISQDPEPEVNLYWYVSNNPLNKIDPRGLQSGIVCPLFLGGCGQQPALPGEPGTPGNPEPPGGGGPWCDKFPWLPWCDDDDPGWPNEPPEPPDPKDDILEKIKELLGGKTLKDAKSACDELKCMAPDAPGWGATCELCSIWKCYLDSSSLIALKQCVEKNFMGCLAGKNP